MSKLFSVRYALISSVISFVIGTAAVVYGGFDLLQKTSSGPEILSIQNVPPEMFSDFKSKFLRPKVRTICMNQMTNKYDGDGHIVRSASDFCDCYVRRVTEAVTKADMVYLEQSKDPPPEMESRMQGARQSARDQCES